MNEARLAGYRHYKLSPIYYTLLSMASPEKDPIKELHALTAKAGESLDDDAIFDAAVREINDKLLSEELKQLDKLIGISRQYATQVAILSDTWILRRNTDGSQGFVGAGGVEYPTPSLLSIVQRFCEDEKKFELLRRKVEQGFTKLIMVPFASPVIVLADAYASQIRLRSLPGGLLREYSKGPNRWKQSSAVDSIDYRRPVYIPGEFAGGPLVYFPTSFDPGDLGGLTKQEAVAQKGAWQVYLVEETPIPREGKGKNINGRKQLEANLPSDEYLKILQNDPQYRGETGLTLELWFMRAMTSLRERCEVIDDFRGRGSMNHLVGTYSPELGRVPLACWNNDSMQVRVGEGKPGHFMLDCGASSAVLI